MTAHLRVRSIPASAAVCSAEMIKSTNLGGGGAPDADVHADGSPRTVVYAAADDKTAGAGAWWTATVWHDISGESVSSSPSSERGAPGAGAAGGGERVGTAVKGPGVVLYPTDAAAPRVRIPHADMSKVEAFYTNDPISGEQVAAFRVVAGKAAHHAYHVPSTST